jgi:hypothetical protein
MASRHAVKFPCSFKVTCLGHLPAIFRIFRKSLDSDPKSPLYLPRLTPTEGRIAIVAYVGWDAVDAAASGA